MFHQILIDGFSMINNLFLFGLTETNTFLSNEFDTETVSAHLSRLIPIVWTHFFEHGMDGYDGY
jgi:hypothetical protein